MSVLSRDGESPYAQRGPGCVSARVRIAPRPPLTQASLSRRAPILGAVSSDATNPPISLLVTDLDNTLWDWFAIWYASFSALLEGIVRISGISQEELEPEIRKVHQRRG